MACVGRWRVGALWVFRNHPAFSPLTAELVYARDGRHYRRAAPGEPLLPLGAEGAWDSRMLTPLAIVGRGAEHLVFYRGANHDHGSDRGQPMSAGRTARDEGRDGGLGLARLPWGQFCGLRADADGLVETKWLCRYGAGGVAAVCATDPGGRVEAELLDHFGRVIPGRERARSRWRPGAAGAGAFCWGDDGGREGAARGPPAPPAGAARPRRAARSVTWSSCASTCTGPPCSPSAWGRTRRRRRAERDAGSPARGGPERGGDPGATPAVVRRLPRAHPAGARLGETGREPGVVVAQQRAQGGPGEQHLQALGGERSDPDGVARCGRPRRSPPPGSRPRRPAGRAGWRARR